MQIDRNSVDSYYHRRLTRDGKVHSEGYFGESFIHRRVSLQAPNMYAMRDVSMDGVHTIDGKIRSIRDLVAQLWFDDWEEATCGAQGLCDLTVPSHPQAPTNRELIGATPSAIEGLERLIRSRVPNAAYNACEALSQLAFRNRRNGARILSCPNMKRSLDDLFDLDTLAMDDDSKYDLRAAILRVFNNCGWNSPNICLQLAEDVSIMRHVEDILFKGSTIESEKFFPLSMLTALDAAVGLLNLLSSDENCRKILTSRQTAEKILLPLVIDAEKRMNPPEQYLCTVAGAVEVIIKLIWNADKASFLPHKAVLQTIVWTLVCALDGVTWAGINWTSLGRIQALSQLSTAQELKLPLIELDLVEVLVRLLNQWTAEQGTLLLELALLALLNLLEFEEARWRVYRTGIFHPFRNIIVGFEGVTDLARERAVLCAWMLFEWQIEKLELLDRKTVDLITNLEESEKARLHLEDEYARVRAALHEDLAALNGNKTTFHQRHEALLSEMDAVQRALKNERQERSVEIEVSSALVASMDGTIVRLRSEIEDSKAQLATWQSRALLAEQELKLLKVESQQILAQRDSALHHRNNALELVKIEHEDLQVENEARRRAESQIESEKCEMQALASVRDLLLSENAELHRLLAAQQEENIKLRRRLAKQHDHAVDGDSQSIRPEDETAHLLEAYQAREKTMASHIQRLQARCELLSAQKTGNLGICGPNLSVAGNGSDTKQQAWSLSSWFGLGGDGRSKPQQSERQVGSFLVRSSSGPSGTQPRGQAADPPKSASTLPIPRPAVGWHTAETARRGYEKMAQAETRTTSTSGLVKGSGGGNELTPAERERLERRVLGEAQYCGMSKTTSLSARGLRFSQNPPGGSME